MQPTVNTYILSRATIMHKNITFEMYKTQMMAMRLNLLYANGWLHQYVGEAI